MKKGQSALEYLMTYGWALLIIVVVGAALYALGVLNPATYQQKTCTGMTYFLYKDHRLTSGGNFDIQLTNGNEQVTITDISVGGTALTFTDVVANVSDTVVLAATGGPSGTTGSPYNYDIVVTYDVTGGISGQTATATCTGNYA